MIRLLAPSLPLMAAGAGGSDCGHGLQCARVSGARFARRHRGGGMELLWDGRDANGQALA